MAVGGLCVIGVLAVWSATRGRTSLTHGDPDAYLVKQLINVTIGVVLAAIASALNHRTLRTGGNHLSGQGCEDVPELTGPMVDRGEIHGVDEYTATRTATGAGSIPVDTAVQRTRHRYCGRRIEFR